MKIIISGGGTGGHIYPALAIAEGIKEKFNDAEILYVGTEGSLEEELSKKAGYSFRSIHVKGLPRKFNKKSFVAARELFKGIGDSKRILIDFRPDLVIGTGGYVCGPIVYKAARMGIATAIHEQNAFPGITNKILSRFVDKVLITYEDSRKYFSHCDQVVKTGNPVRKDILSIDKNEARVALAIDERPLVLSFGGSGGQRTLNDAIMGMISQVTKEQEINLIHVTGNPHYDSFLSRLREAEIVPGENIDILPYHHRIPMAMNAADVIITSGGAIALAEISGAGKPSILIPKAYTAENHQEYNARAFQEKGAAVMILEKDLSPDALLETIKSLVHDREKLSEMSIKSRELGNRDATGAIIDEISDLL